MIKLNDILNKIVSEGGAGGHMAHPFDFANSGKELVDTFAKAIKSLKKGTGSVKIDGVNASIRLVNNQFVLDRGSAKPLDVKGVRPEDLENRFGPGHGFLTIGKEVINIFDEAIPSTKTELKQLGLLDNPNIMLNIEYVAGQTNVVGYGDIGNFLAIHGLKEIKPAKFKKDGTVSSRIASEISYSESVMQSYIDNLNKVAMKHGFKVLGSVDTKFKSEPNLVKVLDEPITLYPNGTEETKSLKDWLKNVTIKTPLITRQQFITASNSKNISEDFGGQDINKIINDTIVYIATIKLGDEVLKNATSEIGDLEKHEGIVVRDKSIYNGGPFKITGSFIIRGLESQFKLKESYDSNLDIIQSALDIVGLEPTIGTGADVANVIISLFRAAKDKTSDSRKEHLLDAAISAVSIIPAADLVKLVKIRKYRKLATKTARAAKRASKISPKSYNRDTL